MNQGGVAMADLTQVILEQAMKFGRTLTIKAANAVVEGPGAPAQMVHIELRPTDGGPGQMWMIPTHAKSGELMTDKNLIGFVQQMAAKLDEQERAL
jgi:hypothetical protein